MEIKDPGEFFRRIRVCSSVPGHKILPIAVQCTVPFIPEMATFTGGKYMQLMKYLGTKSSINKIITLIMMRREYVSLGFAPVYLAQYGMPAFFTHWCFC